MSALRWPTTSETVRAAGLGACSAGAFAVVGALTCLNGVGEAGTAAFAGAIGALAAPAAWLRAWRPRAPALVATLLIVVAGAPLAFLNGLYVDDVVAERLAHFWSWRYWLPGWCGRPYAPRLYVLLTLPALAFVATQSLRGRAGVRVGVSLATAGLVHLVGSALARPGAAYGSSLHALSTRLAYGWVMVTLVDVLASRAPPQAHPPRPRWLGGLGPAHDARD